MTFWYSLKCADFGGVYHGSHREHDGPDLGGSDDRSDELKLNFLSGISLFIVHALSLKSQLLGKTANEEGKGGHGFAFSEMLKNIRMLFHIKAQQHVFQSFELRGGSCLVLKIQR